MNEQPTDYGQPPRKRSRLRIIALSSLGAVVLIVVIAAVASAGNGGTPRTSPTTSVTTDVSPPPAYSPPPPPSPTLGQLEAQWAAGPAGAIPGAMVTVMQQFQANIPQVQAGDFSGVITTCQEMASEAAAALTEPANPDPVVASDLAAAWADFRQAGNDCVSGAEAANVPQIQQATTEMDQGIAATTAATKQLQADCPQGAAVCG